MKQEANKKNKKWLWIAIAAVLVLAVVGVVLALVLGGDGQKDNGPTGGRPELYWNVARQEYIDPETKLSARKPAADGKIYITFAYNGQQVEYPVADKKLCNYIDTYDVVGLVFEDGVIVDAVDPIEIAAEVGKALYVQSVNGDTIIANSSIAMNGMQFKIKITDLTEAYNVSDAGEYEGVKMNVSDLRMMDTITVYANGLEEVTHIYMTNSPVESKVYWRADRFYSSATKETTRVPDENGEYTLNFYCDGEYVSFKTKDIAVATSIDYHDDYKCHYGLRFDEDGYIVEVLNSAASSRSVLNCERYDVTEYDGQMYTAGGLLSNNGDSVTGYITEDTIIYDVSKAATAESRRGKAVEDIQQGDRICAWTDADGMAVLVYITNRRVESPAYYVPTRMYNSTLQSTKREPNAQGYYEVELLKMGENKNKIYRTKDKYAIDRIDGNQDQCIGLAFDENGDIKYVYEAESIFGYIHRGRGYVISDITGSVGTMITAVDREKPITIVLAPDCKVYNVSTAGQYGAETELKVGDSVYGWRQPTGEFVHFHVRSRYLGENTMYYNYDRKYSSGKKETTRTPDADGWYYIDMAHNGKQVTLKTKDKDLVTLMDSQQISAWSLELNGDVIVKAHEGQYATGGQKLGSDYRVISIVDDYVVIKTSAGAEYSFYLSDDTKVYNVTGATEKYIGEPSTMKVGDMVAVYTNSIGEPVFVYIRERKVDKLYWNKVQMYDTTNKCTLREKDADGYYWFDLACDGKEVRMKTKNQWVADKIDSNVVAFGLYTSGNEIKGWLSSPYVKDCGGQTNANWVVTAIKGNQVTLMYTLPGNTNTGKTKTVTLASNVRIYDVTADTENFGAKTTLQVGDLVHTYQNAEKNAELYVYVRSHCTREDGYMSYCEHCEQVVYWNPLLAGDAFVSYDCHYYLPGDVTRTRQLSVTNSARDYEIVLDLNGHTLHNTNPKVKTFLVSAGNILTVLDSGNTGKVIGSSSNANGGILMVTQKGSIINMYGGTWTITDDETIKPYSGGCLYVTNYGTFNMYGGTITGGRSYVTDVEPNAEGKENDFGARGGNVYVSSTGTFNMYDGTISGGTALDGIVTTHNADGSVSEKSMAGRGGNIYLAYGSTANILGGTVEGGIAGNYGGNIYMHSSADVLTVKDATITNGYAQRGGNIYMNAGEATLTNAAITDGVVQYRGGNICAYTGVMNINGGTKLLNGFAGTENDYGYGANLTIYAANVTIDEATIDGGTIITKGTGGNIYCTYQGSLTINDGAVISNGSCPSNGGNISVLGPELNATTNEYRIFTLTINGGTITNGVSGANGGNIWVGHSTVKDEATGVTSYIAGNNVIINGGTITNGKAAAGKLGGNIFVNAENLTISGGTVSGGLCGEVADDVYVGPDNQNLTISGGSVAGLFQLRGSKTLNISGAPVLGKLEMGSNVIAVIGEMKEGASVSLKTSAAGGIFTETCENARAYVDAGYFKASEEDNVVDVNADNKLFVRSDITFVCPHCGENSLNIQWSEWTFNSEGTTGKVESGHYYLAADKTHLGECIINDGLDVCLDVRGNDLTRSGNVALFAVRANASLVVFDSTAGEEKATLAGGSYAAYVNDGATFKAYNCNLKNHRSADSTDVRHGVVTVNASATSATIYLENCTLTAGEVEFAQGAAINGYVADITLKNCIVNGGKVSGNGGAICMSSGKLTIEDTTVNGEVYAGAGGEVTVTGTSVVDNLNLTSGALANFVELKDGASVRVNATPGVPFTKAFDSKEAAQACLDFVRYISTDKEIAVTDNNELVVAGKSVCPHCDANLSDIQWTEWNFVNSGTSGTVVDGHYYLAEGKTHLGECVIPENANVCIDLRGNELKRSGTAALFAVRANATLVLFDSVGGGSAYGGSYTAHVNNGATFKAYNCTLTNNRTADSTDVRHGVVTVNTGAASATVYLEGCTLTAGTASFAQGAVINGYIADVTLNSCTVTGGTVSGNGGAICMTSGKLTIDNTNISGEVYMGVNGEVVVTGTSVVENLNLTSGALADFVELSGTASVKVNATPGVAFTKPFESKTAAQACLEFVQPVDATTIIQITDANELAISGEVVCPHCQTSVSEINWVEWTFTKSADGDVAAGHYYLTGEMGLAGQYTNKADVVLDLRGNTMKRTTADAALVFMNQGTTFTVIDTVGGGKLEGGSYVIGLSKDATFKAYNCTLKNTRVADTTTNSHSVINCSSDTALPNTVYLNNCNVVASNAKFNRGAAVIGHTARITLDNCNVTGGNVTGNGGAIYMTTGSLTVNGGSIVGGNAEGLGDAIYITSGTLNLNGCSVTAGSNTQSDGVYVTKAGANIKLAGTVTIDALNLVESATAQAIVNIDELNADSVITVTANTGVAFTKALADNTAAEAYKNCFNGGVNVQAQDGCLQLTAAQSASVLSMFTAWIGNLFTL